MSKSIKSFIITFLVILAVYQTNKLWFEGLSSHNFFYTVLHNGINQNTTNEVGGEVEYIAVNNGSNRYTLYYDNNSLNDIKPDLIRLAQAAARKGEQTFIDSRALRDIFSEKTVIIRFGCELNAGIFSEIYHTEEMDFKTEFDSVAFCEKNTGSFGIVFFDSKKLEGIGYEISDYNGGDEIRSIIDSAVIPSNGIYYLSSQQSNYDVFVGNEFIPAWSGEAYCNNVVISNPAAENGRVTSASINSFVNAYFENPVLKWTSVDDNVYIFSDETTVVKYYPQGVMEYASYSGQSSGKKTSFGAGLAAAESFLEYDSNLKNDYYLRDYESDGERIIYYFDYKINNLTLNLSEEMKEKLGMKSLIEVTVDGGRVSKYKRYLRDYTATIKDPIYAQKSFLEVIDRGLGALGGSMINSFKIAYIEMGTENIQISYVADIDGKYYAETIYQPTQQE